MAEYTCTKCGDVKSQDQFYWRKDRDCLRQPCKGCISAYGAEYKQRDPVRKRAIGKRSYVKHREKIRVRSRGTWLKKNFGLSVEQYDALFQAQGGVCAICRKPETVTDPRYGQIRALAVDHCHDSGDVRGLLCARCNMALGMFDDDLGRLEAAVAYLKTLPGGGASDARPHSDEIGPAPAP